MTTAVALDHYTGVTRSHRAHPHGLDRAIMRLGIAMLKWARKRADRSAVSYEESVRLVRTAQEREARERETLLMATRVL